MKPACLVLSSALLLAGTAGCAVGGTAGCTAGCTAGRAPEPPPGDPPPGDPPPADPTCATAEGLAHAYQASTGEPLDDGGAHCVRRAVHFPGVVAIGHFGRDHGCRGAGAIVDCQYQKEVDGAKILARAGWKQARPVTREQLARNYVAEVGLVWNMADAPSEAARLANGDIVVTGSVRVVGMSGTASHSPEFRFTPEGVVTRARD